MSHAVAKTEASRLYTVSSNQRPTYLINAATDIILIGGASIFLYMIMSVMLAPTAPDASITWLVFYLSFAVNFPHFLVSYQLLYYDARHMILKKFRFFWAAVIAPAIILGCLFAAIAIGKQSALGYLANAMYFFVGWHYVKQIFGGVVVTNALQKFFYNKVERWALQANLYAMWMISWVSQNLNQTNYKLEGIPYQGLGLSPQWLSFCFWAVAFTAALVLTTHVQKWIREGRLPSPTAMVCFASIYIWFLPVLYHPMYFHIIPFFHSLQYLIFVYAFRRNKVEDLVGAPTTPELRKSWLKNLHGYLMLSVATGAVAFWFLPKYIDSFHLGNQAVYGPTLAMFSFTIFINIHHYFIDNVIWKGNNPDVKKHLFRAA